MSLLFYLLLNQLILFFINITIQREFLVKQNNNNSCIVIDLIVSLWNIILLKQFDCSARIEMINCFFNAMQYDIKLFIIAFEKCISQNKKFPPVYIKSIIEYIKCFQNSFENIKDMLNPIFENIQGNTEIDSRAYSFLFTLVARKKGLKKINK